MHCFMSRPFAIAMSSSSGRFVQAAGGVAVVAVCIVGHFSLTWFATRSVQAEHPWIFGFVVAILVEAVLAVACLAGPAPRGQANAELGFRGLRLSPVPVPLDHIQGAVQLELLFRCPLRRSRRCAALPGGALR